MIILFSYKLSKYLMIFTSTLVLNSSVVLHIDFATNIYRYWVEQYMNLQRLPWIDMLSFSSSILEPPPKNPLSLDWPGFLMAFAYELIFWPNNHWKAGSKFIGTYHSFPPLYTSEKLHKHMFSNPQQVFVPFATFSPLRHHYVNSLSPTTTSWLFNSGTQREP